MKPPSGWGRLVIIAHLVVDGKDRERREVPDDWLALARGAREIIIVRSIRYAISGIDPFTVGSQPHVMVQLKRQ